MSLSARSRAIFRAFMGAGPHISRAAVQRLRALEQDPAGGDERVAALRPVAAMGVGECCRCDQQAAGARRDLNRNSVSPCSTLS